MKLNVRLSRARLLTAIALILAFSAIGAIGQDGATLENDGSKRASVDETPISSKSPFTARISIDTVQPVSYGDDVLISVWITPHQNLDVEQVRIIPAGNMTGVYVFQEQVHEDLQNDAKQRFDEGVPCNIRGEKQRAGIEFVAKCSLTRQQSGVSQLLDPNLLFDAGQQQFEIQIDVRDDVDNVTPHYELGVVDFVSPRLVVVIGGLLGAFVLSFILYVLDPLPSAPRVKNFKDFSSRVLAAAPQGLVNFVYGATEVARRSALGAVTVVLLIILAKSSEGADAPISLHIKDFWGGLFVGLTSAELARLALTRIGAIDKNRTKTGEN